jgi:hypothetical protein
MIAKMIVIVIKSGRVKQTKDEERGGENGLHSTAITG